jgi:predicted DNA-binding transcriptional regulator YafY
MAYSELIKDFERIRTYMKEFYVYGLKVREEYGQKSVRSYDNERRRIESYLGEYMGFHQTAAGKRVFLSIDSRSAKHNPLYYAWKAKSFTDGDITLHFILFDILHTPGVSMTIHEIEETIDADYLCAFSPPLLFDESTIRKKLKEYESLGLIRREKQGKSVVYSRREDVDLSRWSDALAFFSEAGLCGVVGSYLLDKIEEPKVHFSFKHHYITHALESGVLCALFEAMEEKRAVTLKVASRRSGCDTKWELIPLKIFVSVQTGRRYLLAYNPSLHAIKAYRLDYLSHVQIGETAERFDALRHRLSEMQAHMWGVMSDKHRGLEHVEFTIRLGDNEDYIAQRLEREKRCGRVERLNAYTCRYTAQVYDTNEMIPWIRTFLCRITSLNFSNRTVENRLKSDLEEMYRLYEIEVDAR